jgi:dTDP-4-amino-4,6-dideoxygalactose transaminase
MVPFIDLNRVHSMLGDSLRKAFDGVMASGHFILGPQVMQLEETLAKRVDVAHAIGVSSGTDALLAVLMALEIGPGDEVIVPTFTFFATAGAVSRVGARPVFADVDPTTLLLDPESAMSKRTSKTRAVVPVHLFGQCAPIGRYLENHLTVIEDAAQALDASDGQGIRAGAQGTVGCFSFFPTKPLGGMGDGGMVTTNDDTLAGRIRQTRVHGARPKFHHLTVGGNFRLDTLQAALLLAKVPHLDSCNENRRRLARRYRKHLGPIIEAGHIRMLDDIQGHHVYNQFVIRADGRDPLRQSLKDAGIGTAVYYPEPLHVQPCFEDLGGKAGDLPVAEAACKDVLALPCFPGMTNEEHDEVIAAIGWFYAGR